MVDAQIRTNKMHKILRNTIELPKLILMIRSRFNSPEQKNLKLKDFTVQANFLVKLKEWGKFDEYWNLAKELKK